MFHIKILLTERITNNILLQFFAPNSKFSFNYRLSYFRERQQISIRLRRREDFKLPLLHSMQALYLSLNIHTTTTFLLKVLHFISYAMWNCKRQYTTPQDAKLAYLVHKMILWGGLTWKPQLSRSETYCCGSMRSSYSSTYV